MSAKMIRIILERITGKEKAEDEIAKLRFYSFMLMISILSMFLMKFVVYL